MANVQRVFRLLRSQRDASVGRAMVEALPTADAQSTRLIALSLLERKDVVGCAKLIERLDDLPDDIHDYIVSEAERLSASLSVAVRGVGGIGGAGRRNAIDVIVSGGVDGAANLLAGVLTDPRTEIAEQAAQGLLALIKRRVEQGGGEVVVGGGVGGGAVNRMGNGRRDVLLRAVYDAVQRFEHHGQEAVLEALCVMIGGGLLAASSVRSLGAGVCQGLSGLLVQPGRESVQAVLVALLSNPNLSGSARVGIERAVIGGDWGQIVGKAYLLLDPMTRLGLERVTDPHDLWPDRQSVEGWSGEYQRGAVYWADALPWLGGTRIEKLAGCTGLRDPMARLAALRRLMRGQDEASLLGVSRYCEDEHAVIARIATRHLVRCDWQGLGELSKDLVVSKHYDLRLIAGEYLGPAGFTRLWNSWSKLGVGRRLLMGKALVKIDPRFHIYLSQKLASRGQKDKLRAMAIIRCLGQGQWFDRTLQKLCEQPDSRIASSAVMALGSTESRMAIDTIRRALDNDDSRVRANAIEVLEYIEGGVGAERLVAMSRGEENRPRANAIAAMIKHDPENGLAALRAMLEDPRQMHRLSALWAASSAGATEVAPLVGEMALSDPDPQVRVKAKAVTQRFIEMMGTGVEPAVAA